MIVGGSGYLGGVLVRRVLETGDEPVATYFASSTKRSAIGWHPVDIRDRTAVLDLVQRIEPDVVINAAYRPDDWDVTAEGAAHVALGARRVQAHLIQVSSDMVFSGSASPYSETAIPDPITPYGAAKAAAEVAVLAAVPAAAIVRTSLILGDGRSPHERFVRDLVDGRPGVLFADEVRCPVHIADLSAALVEVATSRRAGVLHVSGPDGISRYQLGCLIARREGLDVARLRSGHSAELNPSRPVDLRLDCRETVARLQTRIRGAREFLSSPPTFKVTDDTDTSQ